MVVNMSVSILLEGTAALVGKYSLTILEIIYCRLVSGRHIFYFNQIYSLLHILVGLVKVVFA